MSAWMRSMRCFAPWRSPLPCMQPCTRLRKPSARAAGSTAASRRQASLALLLPIVAPVFPRPAGAAEEVIAPVRPALTPTQYLDRIEANRGPAFQQLGELLDRSKFKEAAEALVLFPVDDVVQSAFYLPWAVLALDEQRAIQVQTAYTVFEDKLFAFRSLCREASSYRAEDEEVVAALSDMEQALDALVSASV